jgi:hypothetical protein
VTGIERWPALAGLGTSRASRTVERATWGKVHGASTDFRWIAATRGFLDLNGHPERDLSVGSEDAPAVFALWRSGDDLLLAARCHPSRAVDAAGRSGALEKPVLAWRRDPALPAAAAAALLLARVEELDDGSWWDEAASSRAWEQDPNFVHDLGTGPEVPTSREALESMVAASCQSLRSWLAGQGGEDLLAALYAGLLAGDRPTFHGSASEQPLPGSAFAAILLPFERRLADRLSIAGWLPSFRRPGEALGERWDLVVHDERLGPPAEIRGRSGEALERARRMARAVLRDDPGELPAPPQGASTARAIEPAVHRATETRSSVSFPALFALPEPPTSAAVWRLLYEFARDPKRRWLDPRRLAASVRNGFGSPDRASLEVASRWIRALEEGPPEGVSREQWATKIDLLRAAILAIAPGLETARAVGALSSGRVSDRYYAQALRNGP